MIIHFSALTSHFVFLMFVVHVLYCVCNFVCCVLFERVYVCFFFWYIVVPLPPGTNPFAANNTNNNNNNTEVRHKESYVSREISCWLLNSERLSGCSLFIYATSLSQNTDCRNSPRWFWPWPDHRGEREGCTWPKISRSTRGSGYRGTTAQHWLLKTKGCDCV